MKSPRFALTLLFALVAWAWLAQQARATLSISGDAKVAPHRMARLTAVGQGEKAAVVWRFDKKKLDAERLGDRILLTGPAGEYLIEAMAVTLAKDGRTTIEEAEFTLVIGGPAPPTPPKPPTPAPDGRLGLTKVSRDGFAGVTSPGKAAEAKKLASSHRAHAAAVAAGAYPDAAKILEAWRDSNKAALDNDAASIAAWLSWAVAINRKVGELHKGGKLPGNNDWSEAFREIADGLDPSGKAENK